jgi:ABC-2 type transport system permease protein
MSVITAASPAATRSSAPGSPLVRLTLTEAKLFWRERLVPAYGVGFPLLLLIIFGAIPSFNKPRAALGGYTELDAYVPILIAFTIAVLSVSVLP